MRSENTSSIHQDFRKPSVAARLVTGLISITAMLTLVSLFARWWWVADLLTNFRVQFSIGICVLLFMAVLVRQWKWLIIGTVLLAINGWATIPYLLPPSQPNSDLPSYRLLTTNVLTSNSRYEQLISLIRDEQPDFIVVMEINGRWASQLSELSELYPHQALHPRSHNFGIGILSRQPWKEMEVHSFGDIQLPWLRATFELDGQQLDLVAVHPLPPMGKQNSDYRNEQLAEVSSQFDPVENSARIITGDFNMTPWSPWFAKVTANSQTSDAARRFGLTRTWQVFPTIIGGLKIDHALVSEEVQVNDFKVGPDIGSDHRPIVVDFSLR